MAQRKSIDCRDYPSEKGCTLKISGTKQEVLDAAVQHAIQRTVTKIQKNCASSSNRCSKTRTTEPEEHQTGFTKINRRADGSRLEFVK